MATVTYQLNGNGYQILKDGQVVIDQQFKPGVEGWVPFADDAEKITFAEADVKTVSAIS